LVSDPKSKKKVLRLGLNKFQCEHCLKLFDSCFKLDKHNVRVHVEKKFSCEICGRGYTYKSDLKKHSFTHSTEPQFECGDCHKKYRNEWDLNQHFRKVHGGVKYKCSS
jgi:hypothetical protein